MNLYQSQLSNKYRKARGVIMNKTKIEYVDYTFNPVTGCLHGCEYCYAKKIANRFGKLEPDVYPEDLKSKTFKAVLYQKHDNPYPYLFEPTFHCYRLDEPQQVKKPSKIFVCSMADLFGDWVPDEWIEQVREACTKAYWHNYLFLTKNPKRYKEIYRSGFDYRCYMWFGTTVTDEDSYINRGMELYQATGRDYRSHAKRFLSIEPLHGKISDWTLHSTIYLIDWIIIGCETGNRKGKVIPKREWIENIVSACHHADVPVFMKNSLRELMGKEFIQEYPNSLCGRKEDESDLSKNLARIL
jgi:protein gp37